MNRKFTTAAVAALIISLTGCSAARTAIKKHDLETKTQMSETVWLDPVGQDLKTVYIQVRNTTDKTGLNIIKPISEKLVAKGYAVIPDASKAHYWIQANILKADKMDLREATNFLSSGYGAGLSGGTIAALAVASQTSHSGTIASAGLIGAAAGFIGDALVEDVNYSLITDVRIVEKSDQEITTTETSSLSNGTGSNVKSTSSQTSHQKTYQTRVVSNANKVNLKFEEAEPELVDGLASTISGIF